MTDSNLHNIVLLAICWSGYFALHSLLASLAVKRRVAGRFPDAMPYYRLTYNTLAVLLLLPILWLGYRNPGATLWQWQGATVWLANGLALAALGCFWLSLKSYDMQEFLGFRQLRYQVRKVEDQEHFHLSPFHRHVRHPWYFFALILIWTRDMSESTLLSSVMMTLYFIVGSRLEEKKLLDYHGDVYRRYMARVPGLFPLPWKFMSKADARALSAASE
jgi:protein-S-isoprenylcysteine O-methyltransferase Ste14